jgi:hypothetical protein
MKPSESWESSSDEEWAETQRKVLGLFATGTSFVKQALAKALTVKLPEPLVAPTPTPKPAPVPNKQVQEYQPIIAQLSTGEITREQAVKLVQAKQREEAKVPAPKEVRYRLFDPVAEGKIAESMRTAVPWAPGEQERLKEINQERRIQHPRWNLPQQIVGAYQESAIPEKLTEPISRIPVVGPKAEEFVRGVTGPATLPMAVAMPGATAWMGVGGIGGYGLGKGIEAGLESQGLPTTVETPIGTWGPAGGLELLGTLAAPWAGPKIAKALPGAVRETMPVAREALVAGERGSVPLGPRVPEEPIVPPQKPPAPPKPPTGDSASALNDYFVGRPASEDAGQSLLARYEGETGLEKDLTGQQLIQGRKLVRKASQYFVDKETPLTQDMIQVIDYQGPIEEAIAKVGLSPEAADAVRIYRQMLDEETVKMRTMIPGWEGREWYYTHEYVPVTEKVSVGQATGRGRFGAKPGFMRQRKLEGTILDNLAERPDLTLKTWNIAETVERRIYRGIIYRQQMVLLENMKRTGLALPASEVVEEGWRVPKIGPAFESKAVPGNPKVFTEPWAAPEKIAKQLEDHFGTSAFSANVPLRVLREAIATAKFVKVFGGLFQNIDYSTRTIGYATKYRDIAMLGEIPKALTRAYVPGVDATVRAMELKDKIVQALYRHGLNREAGLGFVGTEYEKMAGELKLFKIPIAGRAAKAFGSGSFRNAHNSFVTGIGRRIAKIRMAGGMTLDEAAAQTALDINESFSSLPNWQSVFRNPTTRDFLRTFLFSMAEQESWIRMPFRQKTLLASILVDVTVGANILNLIWHGELLPASAYKPFTNIPGVDYDPTKEGPKALGYNTGFLRPELPYTGPLGRKEYLDLLGQADTPIRILADPQFAAVTRLGQLPSAVMQAYSKQETFGEKKIEGVGGWARFAVKQVAPIPATSVFEEAQRIGTVGALLQAGGLNVSAERLGPLFLRRYKELTGKSEKPDIAETRAAVNQYPELLEIQVEREKAGVKLGGDVQGQLLTQRDTTEANLLQMIQSGQPTGVEFRKAYQDFQAKRRVLNEQRTYKEREAVTPEEAIMFEVWDVELQTGADGLPDLETYFADRDAVLQAHAGEVPVETMKTKLRNYESDFWRDPIVRAKVNEMLDAEAVMQTYYSIPAKKGMDAETGNRAAKIVKKAQDTASAYGLSFKKALAMVVQDGTEYEIALLYQKLPDSPVRKQYKKANPVGFAWYSDVPIGLQAAVGE